MDTAAEDVELEVASARPRVRPRARWALLLAALAVMVALLSSQLGGGDQQQVALEDGDVDAPDDATEVDGSEETTSTVAESTTTSTSGEVTSGEPGTGNEGGGAPPPDPSTELPPTTTTTVCMNSFDPSCGPLRWTTAVSPNQPLTVTIEILTEHPVAGQDVEVLLTASDPDATPRGLTVWIDEVPSREGFEMSTTNCYGHGTQTGYGPWSPPNPRPGTKEVVDTVFPHKSGTHWLIGCFTSSSYVHPTDNATLSGFQWCPGDGETLVFEGWACADPYRSFASPIVSFEVHAFPPSE